MAPLARPDLLGLGREVDWALGGAAFGFTAGLVQLFASTALTRGVIATSMAAVTIVDRSIKHHDTLVLSHVLLLAIDFYDRSHQADRPV